MTSTTERISSLIEDHHTNIKYLIDTKGDVIHHRLATIEAFANMLEQIQKFRANIIEDYVAIEARLAELIRMAGGADAALPASVDRASGDTLADSPDARAAIKTIKASTW